MGNQASSGRNLLRKIFSWINPFRHYSASQQLPSTSHAPSFDLVKTLDIEVEAWCMAATEQDGLLYAGQGRMVNSFNKGEEEAGFNRNCGAVECIIIDAYSRVIISAYQDFHIDVTARNEQPPWHRQLRTLPLPSDKGHTKPILSLCLSHDMTLPYSGGDSRFLYSGDMEGHICVWDLYGGRLIEKIENGPGMVVAIATGTSGLVFAASSDRRIKVYRRVAGADGDDRPKHTDLKLLTEMSSIYALMYKDTKGSGGLYVGLEDGSVKFFKQSRDWKRPAGVVFGSHEAAVTCIAAMTAPLLCTGSKDGVITIWRKGNGSRHTQIKDLTTNQNPLRCIAVQDEWEDNNDGPRSSILYTGSRKDIKILRKFKRSV